MSDTPSSQQASPPAPPNAPGSKRVLIVDGSELGGLLQALLQRNGIDAALARTGNAALDLVLQKSPDLAIVELELPDASGVDLVHILQQPRRIPIILIGSSPRAALPEAIQAGINLADQFFQKPLHSRQLLGMVEALLGIPGMEGRLTPPRGMKAVGDPSASSRPTLVPGAAPSPEDEASFAGLFNSEVTEEFAPLPPRQGSLPPLPPRGASLPPAPPAQDAAPDDEEATTIDLAAAANISAELDITVLDELHPQVASSLPPQPSLTPADPSDLMAMWMKKRQAAQDAPPVPAVAPRPAGTGSLQDTNLASLLDAFYSASESGSLLLRRGQGVRRLGVDKGQLVATTTNVAGEQAVDVLLEMGLVPPSVVDAALERTGGKRHEVLGLLAREGTVDREQARAVLERQRRRVLVGSFHWPDAEYELQFWDAPRSAPTPLFMGEAILRGVMDAATLEELRVRITRDMVLAPRSDGPYPLERLPLSGDEARLVIACDGTKTVADLQALSDLPERSVLGLLLGLQVLKLVRPAPPKPATKRAPVFF